ncbi:hypothetical protein GCM10022240_27110 [Microbacterium kribbense]|uniref:TM2 domain-containing protein n=1 Tax=Microbacterium kribbense TaxID=433645 RepID=A0ABP7GYN4_9MICO
MSIPASHTGAFAPAPYTPPPSAAKSFVTAWLLSYLLGVLGVDRFYLGKVGTGILKLITFGGFGVWVLIDLILILTGAMRDKAGRPLVGYDQHKKVAWIVTAALIVAGIVIGSVTAANAQKAPDALRQDRIAPAASTPPAGAPTDETSAAASAAPAQSVEPVEPAAPVNLAASWADDAYGTFATIKKSGTGDSLITLPKGATGGVVTATHKGQRNFAIAALDASNQSTGELLVNTIGAYSGTTAWGLMALGDGTRLQVTADGAWTVTITPFSAAKELTGSAKGTGDMVLLYNGDAAALTATHDGSRNFVVYEATDQLFSMGLLVNEIGKYSGTVPLSAGPSIISVQADGAWTLTAE